MKLLNKPIDVITYHTKEGDIIPIKYKSNFKRKI